MKVQAIQWTTSGSVTWVQVFANGCWTNRPVNDNIFDLDSKHYKIIKTSDKLLEVKQIDNPRT